MNLHDLIILSETKHYIRMFSVSGYEIAQALLRNATAQVSENPETQETYV